MQIRDHLAQNYADIYTPEVLAALAFMAGFNGEQEQLMTERIERRNARIRARRPIGFLDPDARIPGTDIRVQDARDGKCLSINSHDLVQDNHSGRQCVECNIREIRLLVSWNQFAKSVEP